MPTFPPYAEWRNYLPFYRQSDVDDAIMLFKEIETSSGGDILLRARAMAWRSYATLTALQEEWEIKDWGSGEPRDPQLAETCRTLARAARNLSQTVPQPGSPADFDTLWALAFAGMFRRDPSASQMVERAVYRAMKQAEEDEANGVEDSYAAACLSSLLAEASDVYIYQGEIDKALASVYEALYLDSRAGRTSPDWYHWMRALALLNQALLLEDSADLADQNSAKRLYRRVKRIFKEDIKRSEYNSRYEFDAMRVLAAAHFKLNENLDKDDTVERFQRKLRNRKANWTAAKEKNRLKYLPTGDAAVLQRKWEEIADALFPAANLKG